MFVSNKSNNNLKDLELIQATDFVDVKTEIISQTFLQTLGIETDSDTSWNSIITPPRGVPPSSAVEQPSSEYITSIILTVKLTITEELSASCQKDVPLPLAENSESSDNEAKSPNTETPDLILTSDAFVDTSILDDLEEADFISTEVFENASLILKTMEEMEFSPAIPSSPASSHSPKEVTKKKRKLGTGARRRLRELQKSSSPCVSDSSPTISSPASSSSSPPASEGFSSLIMEKYMLKMRIGGNVDASLTDSTKISEDLSRLSPIDQGYRHMLKRLNSNYAIAQFIHNHGTELQNYSLKIGLSKGLFLATDYVIPSDYTHKPGRGLERCHISMFPKLVFKGMSNTSEYELNGKLVVNGYEFTIKNFLNLCDIGPSLLNGVDGYLELQGRLRMRNLLEQVREGTLTPLSNAEKFASYYQTLLSELTNSLTKQPTQKTSDLSISKYKMELITGFKRNQEAVRQYIQGMERAITVFQKGIVEGESSPLLYQVE